MLPGDLRELTKVVELDKSFPTDCLDDLDHADEIGSAANLSYVALLGGCVLAVLGGMRGALPSVFGLLAAYLVLISIVFVGDPRYHYPLVPFAAILASRAALHELPRLRAGLAASERSASVMAFRWAAVMGLFAVLMLANLYFKSIESA